MQNATRTISIPRLVYQWSRQKIWIRQWTVLVSNYSTSIWRDSVPIGDVPGCGFLSTECELLAIWPSCLLYVDGFWLAFCKSYCREVTKPWRRASTAIKRSLRWVVTLSRPPPCLYLTFPWVRNRSTSLQQCSVTPKGQLLHAVGNAKPQASMSHYLSLRHRVTYKEAMPNASFEIKVTMHKQFWT